MENIWLTLCRGFYNGALINMEPESLSYNKLTFVGTYPVVGLLDHTAAMLEGLRTSRAEGGGGSKRLKDLRPRRD